MHLGGALHVLGGAPNPGGQVPPCDAPWRCVARALVEPNLAGRFFRAMHLGGALHVLLIEPNLAGTARRYGCPTGSLLRTQRNFFHKLCPYQPRDKAGIHKHRSRPGIIGIDV